MSELYEMLNHTSEIAIKSLLYLALEGEGSPLTPRQIAEATKSSPSYLAKTVRLLVRAGVLHSVRGANGGVLLAKSPGQITLLEIVEACQGLITSVYCQSSPVDGAVCSFHQAMNELHETTTSVLEKWTLERLLDCPARSHEGGWKRQCLMIFEGAERYVDGNEAAGVGSLSLKEDRSGEKSGG